MTDSSSPRRSRAAGYAVIALAAVIAIAAAAAVALHGRAKHAVSWRMTDYRLVDARHVEVTFDVTKAPLAEAACTLRARDESSRVVGTAEVTVGPRSDDRRTTSLSRTVVTTAPAERAELVGCHITRTR